MILGGRVGDAIFHLTSRVKTYEEAFSASAIKFVLNINFVGEVDPQCHNFTQEYIEENHLFTLIAKTMLKNVPKRKYLLHCREIFKYD